MKRIETTNLQEKIYIKRYNKLLMPVSTIFSSMPTAMISYPIIVAIIFISSLFMLVSSVPTIISVPKDDCGDKNYFFHGWLFEYLYN